MLTASFEAPGQTGQRYDLGDFINPQTLQALTGERYDSATTAFFLRDLTEIMGRTFDIKYPDLAARQLFPVWSGVDPGAESFVWRQFNRVGAADLIDTYAADLPSSEVQSQEFQQRIVSLGSSYNYSIQDLRKARMAGIPLETRKALAARRSIEQAVEQIAFFGLQQNPDTATGAQAIRFIKSAVNTNDPLEQYGFTNFPNINSLMGSNQWVDYSGTTPVLATGISVSTIINDLNSLQMSIVNASKGVHTPNTLLLPLSTYSALATAARSVTFTDDSVLQYMMKQSPWIKEVRYSTMLEKAGKKQDNTTPGPRIMLWEKNEENAQLVIPQEFEQLPPQMVNLTFKIPCHMRIGGMRISYPKAIAALDGTGG
jgi:hypothetical protein